MGLLDDAIREHLELKRRRGADAEEVTRQEQEALGAPQRAEFADAAPAGAARRRGARAAGGVHRSRRAPARADEPEPEPEPEPREPEPTTVAARPGRRSSTRRRPRARRPTAEPEPGRRGPAAAEGDEDVLEETPDFLQETPEHDRLWFEQKPPRDFDLDR